MTSQEFDEKYKRRGGLQALVYLVEKNYTLKYIGEHFGVSPEPVRAWIDEVLGMKVYDPVKRRREHVVSQMIKFAEENGEEKFREAYRIANPDYFDEALGEAYARGIFKKEEQ